MVENEVPDHQEGNQETEKQKPIHGVHVVMEGLCQERFEIVPHSRAPGLGVVERTSLRDLVNQGHGLVSHQKRRRGRLHLRQIGNQLHIAELDR